MSLIFVAYRRGDTKWITGRLYDRLRAYFGKSAVFMDVETGRPGLDFRKYIEANLDRCKVVVAIIGPQWIGVNQQGLPRIFNKEDWVRIEIETALEKSIPIIPVCIDQTPMPKADDLPASLQQFPYLQSIEVDSGRNFNVDMRRPIRAIRPHLGWGPRIARPRSLAVLTTLILLFGFFYWTGWFDGLRTPILSSAFPDPARAIAACNVDFTMRCAKEGGAFGSSEALARLKSCKVHRVILSDEPSLGWKDIWTTSVFSFQPGGGGPGGGKDDDVLKVGGWGDWYFSLIQFSVPPVQRKPQFAALALYSKESEGASVPINLDRLIARWDFPKGGTLWWKDRPGQRAVTTDPLPAPKKEQWYIIDITSLVNDWIGGKFENFGLQLRPAHEFGSFVFFVSSDAPDKSKIPRLVFCD